MNSFHAATEGLGVDVCLTESSETAPHCPHGPMLLFERFYKYRRSSRRFYACSAARDRKDCPFFKWEDEKVPLTRDKVHQDIIQASYKPYTVACNIFKKLLGKSINCHFCHTCALLFCEKDKKRHQAHDVEQVYKEILSKPTKILRPRENEKTQAQYLFSNKTSQLLISIIKELGFKNVLCLGTPRLHEEIQCTAKSSYKEGENMDSLLLDIDYRYAQFFPPSQFCWYNMFNHFFFENYTNEETFRKFLSREELVLIMDPPFGGLVEVLAVTVKKIWNAWRMMLTGEKKDEEKELPTLWIFPYFMESHIKAALPSLAMLDYKVDYENHPHFKSRNLKGSKRGSPVRIFTNIAANKITLPSDEGYRFCKICNRYVSAENVHCSKCDGCMSKDGRQYMHCDRCKTCVKPGRQHCVTCGRCETPDHRCGKRFNNGCHICGGEGHKRRDCPNRPLELPKKRRKRSEKAELVHSSTLQLSAKQDKTLGTGSPGKNRKKKRTK